MSKAVVVIVIVSKFKPAKIIQWMKSMLFCLLICVTFLPVNWWSSFWLYLFSTRVTLCTLITGTQAFSLWSICNKGTAQLFETTEECLLLFRLLTLVLELLWLCVVIGKSWQQSTTVQRWCTSFLLKYGHSENIVPNWRRVGMQQRPVASCDYNRNTKHKWGWQTRSVHTALWLHQKEHSWTDEVNKLFFSSPLHASECM